MNVLRKSYRVKTEKDFQKVFKEGHSVANRAFVIYTLPQKVRPHFRVGISVGKRVGHTAVARNRLKRYIRAVLIEDKAKLNPHFDLLVIARPYSRDFDMAQTRKNLEHALILAHVLDKDPQI